MKISSLFEMTTTISSPSGLQSQQAPKFGRDPNVLEDEKIEETTAGSIASVAQPVGGMQRRGKGSMFQGISSSEKFPNSRKAGIKEEAISEDDISEEQLLTKTKREEFFNKSKARDIGNRPEDRDIIAKEEFDGGGEYNDEVDMVQNNLHTIVRVSTHLGKELQADENLPEWVQEKIAVAKSVMVTVMDYMISQHERGNVYTVDENIEGPGSKRDEYTQEANALKAWLAQNSHDQYADHYGSWSTWNNNRMRYEKLLDLIKRLDDGQGMAEVAPPGAKAERMVKHIKKSYSKDGNLSPKEKSIAYATAWKAHNKGTVEGAAEGLDEAVGGNYLYHATSAGGLKGMLSSGSISQAKGPQKATQAQTAMPTVSVTRDWGYASGSTATQQSFGGIGRDAVIVLDRNSIESNFKTLGTSQSHDIRGLPRINEPELAGRLKMRAIAMRQPELKGQNKMNFGTAKAGGEFEEAVVVPKGALPLKGTMVGFWVNPKSELMKDPAIMNDPRRLDMPRPNQFVKAAQQQGMAEESKGLWANIHAKRDRIKQGSGERMRKPGSKGAPTADALRKSAK